MKFINKNTEKLLVRTPIAQGMYAWTWMKPGETIDITTPDQIDYAKAIGLTQVEDVKPIVAVKNETVIETKVAEPADLPVAKKKIRKKK